METQEITPEWVKENICMDDGNDITECYSEGTIEHIAWCLRSFEELEYLDYDSEQHVLESFHLKYKSISSNA